MALFTDTVTIYNKSTSSWIRTVVDGVQWSDKADRINNNGRIKVDPHATITFPEGTYDGLKLDAKEDEDAILYGVVPDMPNTSSFKLSEVIKRNKGGIIQSVNDNSNRDYLKNIKVTVGK
jgi:hypothetical protein